MKLWEFTKNWKIDGIVDGAIAFIISINIIDFNH